MAEISEHEMAAVPAQRTDGERPVSPNRCSTSRSTKNEQPQPGVDWVVFGVTAVIALGFLVWGFVSTAVADERLRHRR